MKAITTHKVKHSQVVVAANEGNVLTGLATVGHRDTACDGLTAWHHRTRGRLHLVPAAASMQHAAHREIQSTFTFFTTSLPGTHTFACTHTHTYTDAPSPPRLMSYSS